MDLKYLWHTVVTLLQTYLSHNSGYCFELVVQPVITPYNVILLNSEKQEKYVDQGVL